MSFLRKLGEYMNKWLDINTRKTGYSYNDVFEESLQYFNGDSLAASTFVGKYALKDPYALENPYVESNPTMMHERLSSELARIDCNYKFGKQNVEKSLKSTTNNEVVKYCNERIDFYFGYLKDFKKIVLQGSPSFGLGNNFVNVSLSNCVVVASPEDNMSSIMETGKDLANLFKRRCGVGLDISTLRPDGAKVANSAGSSTGAWSFADYYSNVCRMVGQSGRRGALMITIDVKHPDADKFTAMKQDLSYCTGANVSLKINNSFMEAVKDDLTWEMNFPLDLDVNQYIEENPGEWKNNEAVVENGITKQLAGQYYVVNNNNPKDHTVIRRVKAKDLWYLINDCARKTAEPGLLFWDNYNSNLPACEYEQFQSVSVNPCSEIALSPYDSCRLVTLNVTGFVKKQFTEEAYFDFEEWEDSVKVAMRIMDNIVDLEIECLEKIIEKVDEPEEKVLWNKLLKAGFDGRRTGLGDHAWGDMFAKLRILYGSDESIELASKIKEIHRNAAYLESCNLAIERGAFPIFDWEKEKNNLFISRLPKEIQDKMAKTGRRNISLLTNAPTGSVSIVCQTSSGIEPVFMNFYTRRKKINPNDEQSRVDFVDSKGDKWEEFPVFHHNILRYFETFPEIEKQWKEIETTTNPKDWSEKLKGILPVYFNQAGDIEPLVRTKLLGTMQQYVDHGMSNTINLAKNTKTETIQAIYEDAWKAGLKGVTVYVDGSRSGVLVSASNNEAKITKTHAPVRPKELVADIHRSIIDGQKWTIFVGLLDGKPYEIFGGLGENVELPKRVTKGKIVKRKLSKDTDEKYNIYDLVYGDEDDPTIIKDIVNQFKNQNYATLTKHLSMELRHGIPLEYIIEQNRKDTNPGLYSFYKVTARVLSKYLIDENTGEPVDFCKSGSCE
jgi:ribonucleoside-diphosphate reductase alpha chain